MQGLSKRLIMVLAWLARWSARHEVELKERWDALQRRPWVGRMRRQYAPLLAWLCARLSPGSYLGLQLTVGVVATIGAAWLFGGIAEDVVHRDSPIQVDAIVAQWLQDHSVAGLTVAMLAVSRAHEWLPVLSVTALLCLYFWRVGRREWLQVAVLTVPLGMLLNWGLKLVFRRPRPTVGDYVQALQSYSFPSGHTVAATLLYGLLAVYLVSIARTWNRRVAVVAVAVGCVWLVAFSRLYLGVHYLSDVLAAMALGLFWVALCTTSVHTLAAARRARAMTVSAEPIEQKEGTRP